MCVVFQSVPQAGLTWKVLGFTPLDLVGHLKRCLSVPARHWLWGVYPTSVDWIVPVTKLGQLRIPDCVSALYRLAVFTDLPYSCIIIYAGYIRGGQCGRYTPLIQTEGV